MKSSKRKRLSGIADREDNEEEDMEDGRVPLRKVT
jgi:hypothetical protein